MNFTHQTARNTACPCGCGFDALAPELLQIVERLETFYYTQVSILRGCQCERVAAKDSLHGTGQAIDILIFGIKPSELVHFLEVNYPDSLGIGQFGTYVHIDLRAQKARWIGF